MAGGVRGTDPWTSYIAIDGQRIGELQRQYLWVLSEHGPQTTWEIAGIIHRIVGGTFRRDSFSPRTRALLDRGLVEQCGERVVAGTLKNVYRLCTEPPTHVAPPKLSRKAQIRMLTDAMRAILMSNRMAEVRRIAYEALNEEERRAAG